MSSSPEPKTEAVSEIAKESDGSSALILKELGDTSKWFAGVSAILLAAAFPFLDKAEGTSKVVFYAAATAELLSVFAACVTIFHVLAFGLALHRPQIVKHKREADMVERGLTKSFLTQLKLLGLGGLLFLLGFVLKSMQPSLPDVVKSSPPVVAPATPKVREDAKPNESKSK